MWTEIGQLIYLFGAKLPVPFPPPTGGGTLPPPPSTGGGTLPPLDGHTPTGGTILDPFIHSATAILQQSLDLAQNTAAAWQELWEYTIFDPQTNYLWDEMVSLGLKLAVISLVYVTLTEGSDYLEKQDYSSILSLFIWPLVIVFFWVKMDLYWHRPWQ